METNNINEISIVQMQKADERKKLAQSRAVNLRLRKENRSFVDEDSTKEKAVAVKDANVKSLQKISEDLKESYEKLSKEDKLNREKVAKMREDFEEKMIALSLAFDEKQKIKYKEAHKLVEKGIEIQGKLNKKYQKCYIAEDGEVKRILAPFIGGIDRIVVVKHLPCNKYDLAVMAENLQNEVDEFIINTETLNDIDLSNAIDKFIE